MFRVGLIALFSLVLVCSTLVASAQQPTGASPLPPLLIAPNPLATKSNSSGGGSVMTGSSTAAAAATVTGMSNTTMPNSSMPNSAMPSSSMPSSSMPSSAMPNTTMPSSSMPSSSMPSSSMPSSSMPSSAMPNSSTPSSSMPSSSMPSSSMPSISMPSSAMPSSAMPNSSMPSSAMPSSSMPSSAMPSMPSSSMPSMPNSSMPSSAMPSMPSSAMPSMPSMPSSAMASMPNTAMPSMPSTAMANMPSSAMPSMPSSAMANMPSTAMASMPSTAMASMPSTAMASMPSTAMASMPSSAMPSMPSSAMPSSAMASTEAPVFVTTTGSMTSSQSSVKPGECPTIPTGIPFNCPLETSATMADNCSYDYNCTGDMKCCQRPCTGRQCVEPAPPTTTVVMETSTGAPVTQCDVSALQSCVNNFLNVSVPFTLGLLNDSAVPAACAALQTAEMCVASTGCAPTDPVTISAWAGVASGVGYLCSSGMQDYIQFQQCLGSAAVQTAGAKCLPPMTLAVGANTPAEKACRIYDTELECLTAAVNSGCGLAASQFVFNMTVKMYQPIASLSDPTCVLTGTTPAQQYCATGSSGKTSCAGLPNGSYQSCNSCTNYTLCNSGVQAVGVCPPNTVWDDSLKRCAYNSTTCTTPGPCPTGAVGMASCAGLSDGDYQACATCTSYLRCLGGVFSSGSCQANMFWDDDVMLCVANSTTCTQPAKPICVPCMLPCPYGSVMAPDGCPTCTCIQPCFNFTCASGMMCQPTANKMCGAVPCPGATFTAQCVQMAASSTPATPTDGTSAASCTADVWASDPMPDLSHQLYEALICAGNTEQLVCPQGYAINITSAFYGRNSSTLCLRDGNSTMAAMRLSVPTAMALVTTACNDMTSCTLAPQVSMFTDLDADMQLYLTTQYTCQPMVYHSLQCQGSGRLELECPAGMTILVSSALYGRDDLNTTCPSSTATPTSSCTNPLALPTVQQLCNGRSMCSLSADNTTFSDPCPASNKYLRVQYSCMECENALGDDFKCQYMANQGACATNSAWMMTYCSKACTRCELAAPPCVNGLADSACQTMAAAGQCSSNPAYMYAYCRKTCLQCDNSTQCVNKFGTALCDTWADENQCYENPDWMLPNCTQSCFLCNNTIKCENALGNDANCDYWAMNGQCNSNPVYMLAFCYKSCFNCDSDPVCANSGATDAECTSWAQSGDCSNNAAWMFANCWKACTGCTLPPAVSCVNAMDDSTCEAAALMGRCDVTQANNVFASCFKSCSRCASTASVSNCVNQNDTACQATVAAGQCTSNPQAALSSCMKACSLCDQPAAMPTSIGASLLPGTVQSITSGATVIVPGAFPNATNVAYFTAFFANSTPVYLQIWRPGGSSYSVVYSTRVEPIASNYAQTIPVTSCVPVMAGDRLGFTSVVGPASIAATADVTKLYTAALVRPATSAGGFAALGQPISFSLSAVFQAMAC